MKSIVRQIEELRTMKVADLVKEYLELFGKDPKVKHREYLWKRIAWKIQEQRFGGLPGPAQRRLDELIREIDLPIEESRRAVTGKLRRPRAPGAPAVGTTLIREWRGREYRLMALEDGFEVDGVVYASLSAAARGVTGSRWNGNLFWRRTPRRKNR